jgi:ATP-dependent helicase/nuclease subunit B
MDHGATAVPGITPLRLPRRDFLAHVAARLLDAHGATGLRQTLVILPDLHAVNDVARALKDAARAPVVLLPRITTLRMWADDAPLEQAVIGDAARAALLYRALSEREWFDSEDLWPVCSELGRLFDELTRERVRLAASPSEFAAWLKEAYGTKGDSSLAFEARLVHDLWTAFASDSATLDRESAYVARLAHLSTHARDPLHLIAPGRLTRAEREFLSEYAQRTDVTVCIPDDDAAADQRVKVLGAAWPAASSASMKDRAAAIKTTDASSPLTGRLRIAGASSAEHEAQIVDVAVRERLIAGRERVAVVVQDRITARRARALLERAGVLVSDEAGWAVSTTSAATVVARWLDASSGNFYHRDVLDLLKSPFVFTGWPREQRQRAVWRLEARIRETNAIAGLDRYMALADKDGDAEVRQMLGTLRTAGALLQRRRAALPQWLDLLLESLDLIGVTQGWSADAAGVQLLDLLHGLREQLRGEKLVVGYAEWRLWLAGELDNAAFRDHSVDSPVVFTYLDAVPLRRFDAIIIAGADAAHLPGPDTGSVFLNQGVRAQLGLPTRVDLKRDTDDALRNLIASCDDVVVTWQRVHDGDPNLLAAAIERLDTFHRLAYGAGLHDEALAARASAAMVRAATGDTPVLPSAMPAPGVARALIPAAISASGHNALMSCPYQYYARYVLRLGELDEVQELIEKSDYGERVHAALAAFHREHPRVSDLTEAEAASALERCSEAAFEAAVNANYLARAWLERWRELIPPYLAWQRKREAEGWRVAESEVERKIEITTPAGRRLQLRGRIDRVDRNDEGASALIDYKTQRRERLRAKAEMDGEDAQLPFYALLWNEPVASALFVGLERDGGAYPVAGDVNRFAADVRERLGRVFDRLHEGALVPAHGVDEVCQYCEVSGLCRRNHWP